MRRLFGKPMEVDFGNGLGGETALEWTARGVDPARRHWQTGLPVSV